MKADFRRMTCHMHVLRRAIERGIVMTADDIVRLEELIGRAALAFERPGADRYRITVTTGAGQRLRTVYDSRLKCLVSVWQPRGKRQ